MSNLAPRRPGPSVSRGVYGFVIYLSARLFFVTYLIWAVVPQVNKTVRSRLGSMIYFFICLSNSTLIKIVLCKYKKSVAADQNF